jgi:transposase-like protein
LHGATAGAAESVRAQLPSQSKLTTPRRENRKIRHENELLKAKEPTPGV